MPIVLDIWSHIAPEYGGVGPSAAALATEIGCAAGWQSRLLAICHPSEAERHADIPATVSVLRKDSIRPALDLGLRPPLKQAIGDCDVCHVHGIWLPHSLAAVQLAREFGKPVVSSVHGMLEKWELANKALKKRIYSLLFERRSLARASCLRALSEREVQEYRRFGLRNPIAVVPNGVRPILRTEPNQLFATFPQLSSKKIVLFLARIQRKKGILELLQSWPAVRREHGDAHLLVAGAGDHAAQDLAQSLKLADSVTFCGVLNGKLKIEALSAARLFCLPSHSEGLSVAVLEALSIGLPVVVTAECNVDGIDSARAGFITSNSPPNLSETLCAALSLSEAKWREMGAAAQHLARSRYAWQGISERMRSVYGWLLGGARPDCVVC